MTVQVSSAILFIYISLCCCSEEVQIDYEEIATPQQLFDTDDYEIVNAYSINDMLAEDGHINNYDCPAMDNTMNICGTEPTHNMNNEYIDNYECPVVENMMNIYNTEPTQVNQIDQLLHRSNPENALCSEDTSSCPQYTKDAHNYIFRKPLNILHKEDPHKNIVYKDLWQAHCRRMHWYYLNQNKDNMKKRSKFLHRRKLAMNLSYFVNDCQDFINTQNDVCLSLVNKITDFLKIIREKDCSSGSIHADDMSIYIYNLEYAQYTLLTIHNKHICIFLNICTRLRSINQTLISMYTKQCDALRIFKEIENVSIMKIETLSFTLQQNIEMLIQKMQELQQWLVCLRNYLVGVSNDRIMQNGCLTEGTSSINEYNKRCVLREWLNLLDIIFKDVGGKKTPISTWLNDAEDFLSIIDMLLPYYK